MCLNAHLGKFPFEATRKVIKSEIFNSKSHSADVLNHCTCLLLSIQTEVLTWRLSEASGDVKGFKIPGRRYCCVNFISDVHVCSSRLTAACPSSSSSPVLTCSSRIHLPPVPEHRLQAHMPESERERGVARSGNEKFWNVTTSSTWGGRRETKTISRTHTPTHRERGGEEGGRCKLTTIVW